MAKRQLVLMSATYVTLDVTYVKGLREHPGSTSNIQVLARGWRVLAEIA
jgi:hypothetical protein